MRPDTTQLATVPLFASLDAADLDRVAGWMEVRHVEEGDRLVSEGAGRRTATVTATSHVTLAAMFGEQFRRFERELPEAAELIRRAAAERS